MDQDDRQIVAVGALPAPHVVNELAVDLDVIRIDLCGHLFAGLPLSMVILLLLEEQS